jgi:hypothetical protein
MTSVHGVESVGGGQMESILALTWGSRGMESKMDDTVVFCPEYNVDDSVY